MAQLSHPYLTTVEKHDWLDNPVLEAVISPILLLGRLRLREMKNLTQACQSRFELGLSDSEAPGLLDQGDAELFHSPSCPAEGCLPL